MIKCSHRARALNMHVHVTHQCGMHKNLRFGVCTCFPVWICACVRVSLADCSGRLEIKTLCGTWLMIRRELKQKAEENTGGEKMERGEEKKANGESGRRRSVLSERGRSERLPLLQSYSLCLGCCFVRQTFPIGSLLSAVCFNVKAIGENWWRQRNMRETPKRVAAMSWRVYVHRDGCHIHVETHIRSPCPFSSH